MPLLWLLSSAGCTRCREPAKLLCHLGLPKRNCEGKMNSLAGVPADQQPMAHQADT
jgi:hypothetical protein